VTKGLFGSDQGLFGSDHGLFGSDVPEIEINFEINLHMLPVPTAAHILALACLLLVSQTVTCSLPGQMHLSCNH
jgi:hypothetical protein